MWTSFDKKPTIFLVVLLALALGGQAQQNPQHTLYVMNSYLINPAVGGIESFIDVKAGHRSQWNGISGTPRTTYLSLHAPIKSMNAIPAGTIPIKDKFNSRFDHTTNQVRKHHSVGGIVLRDKTGNFERYQVNLSYSYHLPISKRYTLSMGVSGGVINRQIDLESVSLADDGDPLLSGSNSISHPDLNLGMWLYSKRYYLGISATRLIPSDETFLGSEVGQDVHPSFYMITGFRFQQPFTKLHYVPSVLMRYNKDAPTVLELSLKAIYDQRAWGGIVLKSNEAIALFLGMAVNSTFDFSYSFDYGFTDTIDPLSSGTHEVVLGIRLKNKLKILCPENLW